MDGNLQANLDIYNGLVHKDRDNLQLGVGKEREGKSTLINTNLKYLDPTYNLDRCCFNGKDFLNLIRKTKEPYRAICWDEAQEFSSRSSISRFNRNIVQALSLIGTKNLFIGICLPSYFELEKYAAIHRSNCLMRVYSVDGNRGRFQFYNESRKKTLYLKGKKGYDYNVVKPNFIGRFTKDAFPFDKKEYEEKKMKAMEEGLEFDKTKESKWRNQRNDYMQYLYEEHKLTQKQISDVLINKGNPISREIVGSILRERGVNLGK